MLSGAEILSEHAFQWKSGRPLVADLLVRNRDGEVVVVELKRSKPSTESLEIALSQLTSYMMAGGRDFNRVPNGILFYVPTPPEELEVRFLSRGAARILILMPTSTAVPIPQFEEAT